MTTVAQSEAVTKAAAAKAAGRRLAAASTDQKDEALHRIADALVAEQARILEVNAGDIQRGQEKGLTESFVDRLTLTADRIAGIAADTRQVATLEDPVGHIEDMRTRPNGLQIGQMRVPLGVIGTVFESRPNVTVDIAALCLKSGNATVLRSGSDAHATSSVLAGIVVRGVEAAGLPPGIVQFIESTDRAEVGAMLRAHEYIDLMIPRGGADLIRRVRDEATMPVVAGGIGVCHTYVDASADLEMARNIVVNAKTRRPSICNALDTVLVHSAAQPSPSSPANSAIEASRCTPTNAPHRSAWTPPPSPCGPKTTTASGSRSTAPSASSTPSTTPSSTSRITAAATPRPSSPTPTPPRAASSRRPTPAVINAPVHGRRAVRPRRGDRASPPRRCTPAAPWPSASSPPTIVDRISATARPARSGRSSRRYLRGGERRRQAGVLDPCLHGRRSVRPRRGDLHLHPEDAGPRARWPYASLYATQG